MISQDERLFILKIKNDTCYKNSVSEDNSYQLNTKGKTILKDINDPFILIVIFFDNNGYDFVAKEILLCKAQKNNDKISIVDKFCVVKNEMHIEIFLKNIHLNLKSDFDKHEYITEDFSHQILQDLLTIEKNKSFVQSQYEKQKEKTSHFHLAYDEATFAIKNDSMFYIRDVDSSAYARNPFQQDKDRIIHSKAFRRLVDKAQIFTSTKGDHYRTRLTHTLEVNQIARSIAKRLNLNDDLTEAIALAHDIGHTPFGHVGERTLDDILSGKIDIIKNIKDSSCLKLQQHFKHNYQALRVLSYLENKYTAYDGINLTYLTLEGAWKHTKIAKEGRLICQLADFFMYPQSDFLFPEFTHSISLEGQVVAIADEIAQRSHDIDDAFKSGKINHKTFLKFSNARYIPSITKIDNAIQKQFSEDKDAGYLFIDENDMYRAQLCSKIIDYFVKDVCENFKNENPDTFFTDVTIENKVYKIIAKKVIDFSDEGKKVNNILETMVTKFVIGSSEVSRFDTTAKDIITELFRYYYHNPLTLEKNTLQKFFKAMENHLENHYFAYKYGNIQFLRNELEKIVHTDLSENFDEVIMKKRKLLCQCIADHISGMTDTFALNEYRRIKGVYDI